MLGALAEIFGANFFLSIIGLELVPVHKVSRKVGLRFSILMGFLKFICGTNSGKSAVVVWKNLP